MNCQNLLRKRIIMNNKPDLSDLYNDENNPKAIPRAVFVDSRLQEIARDMALLNTINRDNRHMYQGMMLPMPEHEASGLNIMDEEKLPHFVYPIINRGEEPEETSYNDDKAPPKNSFESTTGFLNKWLRHVVGSTKKTK